MSRTLFYLFLLSLLLPGATPYAQDARQVHEPVVPAICSELNANLDLQQVDQQSEAAPDTARLQAALDQCQQGKAVRLNGRGTKTYFLSGAIRVKPGVSLLVTEGVTLAASRFSQDFDKGDGRCGTTDQRGRACFPFIDITQSAHAGIFGGGIIDGQGGKKVIGLDESWWQIARRAQRENSHQNVPRLIEISNSNDMAMYQIWLKNSPNFHVTLTHVDGFTAWGVHIDTPADARNTDGIDPVSSRNITITKSFIRTGDDNVAIKGGNSGPSTQISVTESYFYSGHGMSIGSETNAGVSHVLVQHLVMDGTTSGLRIKSDVSRGGLVENIMYRDVCLRNVKAPLDFDTHYTKNATGHLIPVYSTIELDHVESTTPGAIILRGFDVSHPLTLLMHDVHIAPGSRVEAVAARWLDQPINSSLNADFQWIETKGDDAKESGGKGMTTCAQRWMPFPDYPAIVSRPQLTEDQAALYRYANVLGYAGLPGKEIADPWDPLSHPISKQVSADHQQHGIYYVDAKAPNASRTQHGAPIFSSVQAAMNQLIDDETAHRVNTERVIIQVAAGTYDELVYLPTTTHPVSLIGAGAGVTTIRANIDAALTGAQFAQRFQTQFTSAPPSVLAMFNSVRERPIIGTFGTPVLWVKSQAFQASDITIENSYNKATGNARQECLEAGCAGDGVYAKMLMVHHQALALMTDGVDRAQFERIRLIGFQDTLYMRAQEGGRTARHFFVDSYIEGDVDFIFGDATAFFLNTEIKSLGDRSSSYVAAPSTNLYSKFGFVFDHCRFTNDGSANAKAGKFFLARQWFHNQRCTPYGHVPMDGYQCLAGDQDSFVAPTGTITKATLEHVGKMVVLNSVIGYHINQSHPWSDWNKVGTLPYRPAQYSSEDFWRYLKASPIDPQKDLGYVTPPPSDIFLGEYHNVTETSAMNNRNNNE